MINNHKHGFTLIELILYVSIVTVFITALVPFAWNVILGGEKSSSQQEVYAQARLISERIKYEIRNSTGVNSVSSNAISLAVSNVENNPTVIDVSSGNVRITLGAAAAENLNSVTTTATTLTFTDYTSSDTKTKHIQFVLTLDDTYTGGRQEYEVPPITIEGSAEVRSN